jgi:hypothetical protein
MYTVRQFPNKIGNTFTQIVDLLILTHEKKKGFESIVYKTIDTTQDKYTYSFKNIITMRNYLIKVLKAI